jgi:hypothetical protein
MFLVYRSRLVEFPDLFLRIREVCVDPKDREMKKFLIGKKAAFTFLALAFAFTAGAATYYTAASGEIRDNIWSTTTNGTPGALPALADGDIIYIDDNITITAGNFTTWSNRNITIYLNATIQIEDQWGLHENTSIIFQTSAAKVIAIGPGNSERIKFGNNNTWSGDDGDLTGPGTLDINFDPDNSPLPIELLFFKVRQVDNRHILEWATASELNFNYFSVEHSTDGVTFKELEQVKGYGNTKERKDYSFENQNALLGKNYYRLKSVDLDGYTEYSRVVLMEYEGEKTFVVAPNPSEGTSINFLMNFVPTENTYVTIFDNSGTLIGVYKPTDSFQAIAFEKNLTGGLYFAKLVTKDFVKVERFIVH